MLTPPRARGPARRAGSRFARDGRGVAAAEFAILLPVILMLWAGGSEMAHAVDNWRKVTQLARTVADLTSQGDKTDPVSPSMMSDILAASTAVLRPFSATNVTIVVSALGVDTTASTTSPRVCSSVATSNATARSAGIASDLLIPAGYGANGNRYVLAEVSMPYAPMLGASLVKLVPGISGTITLRSTFAWPVRNGIVHNSSAGTPEVTLPGGSPCP